ncbi:GAF and ANTAR domain-containing protein [Streptacidiphilus sp. EB129]|uniref:GAF and ANTAR domain-containing protein n=1 Tax=Streptacidiphilus sp. EB129 TaxID=3156262 RepID=UPI0035164EBB
MAAVLARLHHPDWTEQAQRGAVAMGVDGLSVTLTAQSASPSGELLWFSSTLSRRFEDLQFTLGHGPAAEAARTGLPVLEPDLRLVRVQRWDLLPAEAELLPVRAVFSFPLVLGAIQLGALTAVREAAGALTDSQTQDALALAAALTARYLDHWEPPQTLSRAVVHQAVGMLSVQLALSLADSLLRLRAYAYHSGRPISDVSHDIVTRKLRLPPNGSSAETNHRPITEDRD